MMLRFWKYHSLGNDFVLVDERKAQSEWTPERARRVCHRRLGVGADGVLLLRGTAEAAFEMVVFNSDGSFAEMCGNGLRCCLKYAVKRGGVEPGDLSVLTGAGLLKCRVEAKGVGDEMAIRSSLGRPVLERREIPMLGEGRFVEQSMRLSDGGCSFRATAVGLGNPHLVVFCDEPEEEAEAIGELLQSHGDFPQRVNAGFARVEEDGRALVLRVYERGAGLTMACGTGAAAAAVAAVLTGRAEAESGIVVRQAGGELLAEVAGDVDEVWLTGDAREVFSGEGEPGP